MITLESQERLIEQVIWLTRRVYELEKRVGVPSDVRMKHLDGIEDGPHYFKHRQQSSGIDPVSAIYSARHDPLRFVQETDDAA